METFEALRASYLTDGLSDEDVRLIASISEVQSFQDMDDVIVGSSRVDLQACKLEYSIVSPK